jgi:hypothetical protein
LLTDPIRRGRWSWLVKVAPFGVALGLLWPPPARAEPARALSPAQQLALARAYAPTLVFHPQEQYFPANPRGPGPADGAIAAWSSRVEEYRALSTAEKLQRAALAYRVFTRVRDRHPEVAIEYWCYYVYNAFTVRGGWFPYRVHDNHPHDLERLYIVLTPLPGIPDGDDAQWARDAFRIVNVVANAHDGSIAPNQYRPREGEPLAAPVTVMVERGSHAMAPDVDGDGRFTPGVDSSSALKAQWGIRDTGSTWRWYLQSFMEPRGRNAVRLFGPESESPSTEGSLHYALYPAEGLQRWFQELDLSTDDRDEILGRTPWLVRAFGDVRVEELMVPADAANGRALDRMLRRRSASETGFVAGFTTVDHAPTLVVGRRRHWEVPAGYAPDILAEGVALLSTSRRTLFEATIWGSYRVDAITSVLVGYGWFKESGSGSVTVGSEIRMGRFFVRPSWRLSDGGFDSRFTTTF